MRRPADAAVAVDPAAALAATAGLLMKRGTWQGASTDDASVPALPGLRPIPKAVCNGMLSAVSCPSTAQSNSAGMAFSKKT
jgi:hypothetical protein